LFPGGYSFWAISVYPQKLWRNIQDILGCTKILVSKLLLQLRETDSHVFLQQRHPAVTSAFKISEWLNLNKHLLLGIHLGLDIKKRSRQKE